MDTTLPLKKRLNLRVEIQEEEDVVAFEPQQEEEDVVMEPQQEEEEVVVQPEQEVEEVVEPPEEIVVVEPQQDEEELPERFRNKIIEMGGIQETLMYKRVLTRTDVDEGQAHLSILTNKLLDEEYLSSDEKTKIETREIGDREGGLSVRVIDPKLQVRELKLRGKTSTIYSLAYRWNPLVAATELKANDVVHLWFFRSHQRLCIAIVSLREEQERLLRLAGLGV